MRKTRREKYLNQWFDLQFRDKNKITKAKCIDIEFESELGPLFLMKTRWGNKFWLTRREIKEHEVSR